METKPSKKLKTENKKGVFTFKGNDSKFYRITLKEKIFCERYLDFQGNGSEAAFEAYKCKNMQTAGAIAYENLKKPHIIAYIDLKLEERGFCDENVRKQHLFTLNQFADLGAKNKAIDMFYKMKGKYTTERIEVSKNDLSDVSDAELAEMEKTLVKYLKR